MVTRNKRQKKTVQIFVKLDEMKTVLRESVEDKVQDILNTVGGSEQDVHVRCEGKILRKDEQLAIIRMWEENEASRKLMDVTPEGSRNGTSSAKLSDGRS